MVFGAGIPRAVRNLVRVKSVQSYRAIFTRNSWRREKRGGECGRERNGNGDDLSPSFCSPLAIYTSSGYLSLPRFSFVRYSSSFSLLSSFHGTRSAESYGQSQGSGCPPTVSLSPRLRVFVRLEESAGAHCPSLSPVSAPFLRNARHFLPSPIPSLPLLFLFLSLLRVSPLSIFLSPFSYVCIRVCVCVCVYKPPFLHHPRCLFFIWVIWSAQIPPSSAHSSNFVRSFCIATCGKKFFSANIKHATFPRIFFFFFFATTLSYAAATIRFFKRALIDSSNVLEYIPLSKEREREDCNKNVIRGTKESVIRAGSRLGNDPKWIRD